jgi:tyrosinase
MTALFNRRALVLGSAAAVGALGLRDDPTGLICGPGSALSSAQAQPAPPATPRVRHSLATPQGQQMLALYAKAVGRMQALPRHDPRNWYFQSNIHGYPEGRPMRGTRSREMQEIVDNLPPEDRTRWIFSPDRGRTAEERAEIARNRALALGPPGRQGVWHSCSHYHHHFNTDFQAGVEQHFLSWHRMYLHFFEQIAASVLDPTDPPFALPYWDYTSQGADRQLDQLRLPAAFAQPILPDNTPNPLYFAQRNEDFVSGGLPFDVVDIRNLLRLDDMLTGGESGGGFNGDINALPHGVIHNVIGPVLGMGSFEFAGRDPLFWVHHASVDRFWESWRRPASDGRSEFDPPATGWRSVTFNFADATARQVPMQVADAIVLPVTMRTQYDRLIDLGGAMGATSEVRRTSQRRTITETRQPARAPQITEKNVGVPVRVPAPPPSDITAGLRNQENARYYLVIDVEAASAPGGLYRVFARVPGTNGTTEELLGTFSLFGPLADGKRTTTWSSDITRQVRQNLIDPEKPLNLVFRAAYAKPTTPVTIKRVRVRTL